MTAETARVVVIGASAGGVELMTALMARLPADLRAAVFLVLHVPPYAHSQLASILRRVTPLPVAPARDGQPIVPGQVHVGLPDRHLVLEPGVMRLTRGPKECRVRPAIDVLFRSAAGAYGVNVIGVVLSGMLDDGTAGLWAVKDRGGKALVLDPATTHFPSMPRSAIAHVDVDSVLGIDALGDEIARLVDAPAPAADPRSAGQVSERMRVENLIAMEGNGLKAGVMTIGTPSQYTCPDCHGAMAEIKEGPITRFRCHTGHAFSMLSLLVEVNQAIENGLWGALRAVEERVLLLRQMVHEAAAAGDAPSAARHRDAADEAEQRSRRLHDAAIDPHLCGRGDNEL